jgi:Carboxypeptidase regulatory-like domain
VQQRKRIPASRLGAARTLSALIVLASVASARAHVRAQEQPERAGSGVDALGGVYEVPLAVPSPQRLNTRLGVGYGWTESVLEMNDAHHRLQLDAAASVTPLPWLSTALRVLGRYDVHTGGVSDSGVITETHLGARATFPLGAGWHAGTELAVWLPAGNTVGKALSALSGDLQLLLAYAPELSPITIGLALGMRVDRSKYAGGDPSKYSAADRLALGVSDAVLAAREGLAFSYRVGQIEWVAEWAFRMYFARIAESPMWIRAGLRYRPAPRLQLELLLGVSPSKRPSLADGAPLAVIEPRLSAGLSATYAWSSWSPRPSAARVPAPAEAPQRAVKPPASVRGQVLTPSGTALAGATLRLSQGDVARTVTSDAQGAFGFAELPEGQYSLRVVAEGFIEDQQSLDVKDGDAPELHVTLKRELPQGQIRGTVRRFNGKPVVASIAIAELEVTQQTHDDGTFEINVPPGEYSLAVKARGFRPQTRKARVELHGVAILIVELEVAK